MSHLEKLAEYLRHLSRRNDVLLLCLFMHVVLYWLLVFVLPPAGALVAYQRF
ncbi:MAG: hypothetical protein HRU17_09365 [Polyangiaceae bacterium]|nr:hypothetical protein [Polyangiaceae bacterium]